MVARSRACALEHKQSPTANSPTAKEPTRRRRERSTDEDPNYTLLSEIQASHEASEAVAALRAVEQLSEQLLHASRKLELAVAETARLHRALTERHSAAQAAEQRGMELAMRLRDCEQALEDKQRERAEAAVTIQVVQSQLREARLHAARSVEALQSDLLAARTAASLTAASLRAQLAELRASTSWRVTFPLRLARTLIGRLTNP